MNGARQPESDATRAEWPGTFQTSGSPRAERSEASGVERLAPQSYEQAAQMLREASSRGNVAIDGSGSRGEWYPPAREVCAAITSQELTGIVRYTPADLTVCVRAGTPLDELQRALHANGQWLALDPHPSGTLGGLIAANDNGPVRVRYGAVRDALIGVRIALPNGAVARFGGDVVKNVAGYDLTKAYVGSAGTLGLIVEASFKVRPLPPAAAAWRAAGAPAALRAAAATLRERELPFAAVELAGRSGDEAWRLDVLAHGETEVVERLGREFAQAVHDGGLDVTQCAVEEIETQAARPSQSGAWMRVGVPRAACFSAIDALPDGVDLIARPTLGICELFGSDAHAEALGRYAGAIVELGGHVHLRRGEPALRDAFGWWRANAGGGARLFAMLKQALDPEGRCNPGRTIYDHSGDA